jgi:hypothetical protein
MDGIKFLELFSQIETLPVDLDDHVLPELMKLGVTDEIYPFYDSKLPSGALSGLFVHENIPWEGGTLKRMATIHYGPNPEEMQRLVACKECLHLLDPENCRVNTPEDLKHLISKIVLPPELVDANGDGYNVFTDRMAILQAVAVLFPLAARDILLPAYKAGKIDLEAIAELAELPTPVVVLVMSDEWPKIYGNVLKVLRHIHQA